MWYYSTYMNRKCEDQIKQEKVVALYAGKLYVNDRYGWISYKKGDYFGCDINYMLIKNGDYVWRDPNYDVTCPDDTTRQLLQLD